MDEIAETIMSAGLSTMPLGFFFYSFLNVRHVALFPSFPCQWLKFQPSLRRGIHVFRCKSFSLVASFRPHSFSALCRSRRPKIMVWSAQTMMAIIPTSELFPCLNDTLVDRIHRPISHSELSYIDGSVCTHPEVSPLECVKFPARNKTSCHSLSFERWTKVLKWPTPNVHCFLE